MLGLNFGRIENICCKSNCAAVKNSRSRISYVSFAEKQQLNLLRELAEMQKPNLLREFCRNAEAESLARVLTKCRSRISCESFDEMQKLNPLREL